MVKFVLDFPEIGIALGPGTAVNYFTISDSSFVDDKCLKEQKNKNNIYVALSKIDEVQGKPIVNFTEVSNLSSWGIVKFRIQEIDLFFSGVLVRENNQVKFKYWSVSHPIKETY